jgi:hypothetical protein
MRKRKIVNKIYELAPYVGEESGGASLGTCALSAEKINLAVFRGTPTLLRAIYFELIPTCRPASFISPAVSPLAPAGHSGIATLLAAIALSRHGSNHSHKALIFNGLNP